MLSTQVVVFGERNQLALRHPTRAWDSEARGEFGDDLCGRVAIESAGVLTTQLVYVELNEYAFAFVGRVEMDPNILDVVRVRWQNSLIFAKSFGFHIAQVDLQG
jgi:hypothetical protein